MKHLEWKNKFIKCTRSLPMAPPPHFGSENSPYFFQSNCAPNLGPAFAPLMQFRKRNFRIGKCALFFVWQLRPLNFGLAIATLPQLWEGNYGTAISPCFETEKISMALALVWHAIALMYHLLHGPGARRKPAQIEERCARRKPWWIRCPEKFKKDK